jgi:hypothetical protein
MTSTHTTTNDGITITTNVKIVATIELTEGDLRALEALAGYGDDAFLKAFYVKLGMHYMKPFERDLRGLFARIRSTVPKALQAVLAAREALGGKK